MMKNHIFNELTDEINSLNEEILFHYILNKDVS